MVLRAFPGLFHNNFKTQIIIDQTRKNAVAACTHFSLRYTNGLCDTGLVLFSTTNQRVEKRDLTKRQFIIQFTLSSQNPLLYLQKVKISLHANLDIYDSHVH